MDRGYVYILTNDRLNVLYVGCTNDLRKRLVGLNRAKKDALVVAMNPERRDLFDDLVSRVVGAVIGRDPSLRSG